jgi:excisionase family DNA binding protein
MAAVSARYLRTRGERLPLGSERAQRQPPVAEDGQLSATTFVVGARREILDMKAAAEYLGISRSHLSHILSGRIAGVPAIPHVRAGRRALIRRSAIDRWIVQQEQGPPL